MSQIVSMTGPISSLRAQLRAQAEAALVPENKSTRLPIEWVVQ